MLKKIFFIFAVAVLAASCMDKGTSYSASYALDASFEYGNIFKSDSLFFDKQYGYGVSWQDLSFYHKLNDEKTEFRGGFILSRLKGSGESEQDRYRVNSGVGYFGSSCYMVYYASPSESDMPSHDIMFTTKQYGICSMVGCFVNNTKEFVNVFNESFAVGDSLAVKMTGYLGGEKTGESKFLLAKKSATKDSLVTGWKAFRLDKLAEVDAIEIEMLSNRNDIPKAFCLDDMVANISISY